MVLEYEEFRDKIKAELLSYMSEELNNSNFSADIETKTNDKGIAQEVVIINTTKKVPEGFQAPSLSLVPVYDNLYCRQWQCNFERTCSEMARTLEYEYRERWNRLAPNGEVAKEEFDEEAFQKELEESRTTKYVPKDIFFVLVQQDLYEDVPGTITIPQPGGLKLLACIDATPKGGEPFALAISDKGNMKYEQVGLSDEDIMQCALKYTEKRIPMKITPLNYDMYAVSNTSTFFVPNNELWKMADQKGVDIIFYPLLVDVSMFEYVKSLEDVEHSINSHNQMLETDKEIYRSEVLVYDHVAKKIVTAKDYIKSHELKEAAEKPPAEMTAEEKSVANAVELIKAGRGL